MRKSQLGDVFNTQPSNITHLLYQQIKRYTVGLRSRTFKRRMSVLLSLQTLRVPISLFSSLFLILGTEPRGASPLRYTLSPFLFYLKTVSH